jgi:hypothetical protein
MGALIPGSFKTIGASGAQLLGTTGDWKLTPQDPETELPVCCCLEPVGNDCHVCHLPPPTDCPTGPGLNAYFFCGFEISGGTPGTNFLSFEGGTMGLAYDGDEVFPPASCIWQGQIVTDPEAYQRGLFNYDGLDGFGDPCTIGDFLFELPNGDPLYTIGCSDAGTPFQAFLSCFEVPSSWSIYDWYEDLLGCIGGSPGLAWALQIGCSLPFGFSWLINCGTGFPTGAAELKWAWIGFRQFTSTPGDCYGAGGTYCELPILITDGGPVWTYEPGTIPMTGVVAIST